jgi:hypothetical protein
MPPRSVTSLARAGCPKAPATAPPMGCVLFADAFQRLLTAHRKPGFCVVCLPAIGAFERHSTQHLLHYRPPFGPVRFGSTYWVCCSGRLRLRLPTPGLVGSPHVHSSCLVPVSFAGMSTYLRLQPPRAFAQVLTTAGLYKARGPWHKAVSAKKNGSPTVPRAHGPCPSFTPLGIAVSPPPPRGGGARHSGISPCSLVRPQQPVFILFILYHSGFLRARHNSQVHLYVRRRVFWDVCILTHWCSAHNEKN